MKPVRFGAERIDLDICITLMLWSWLQLISKVTLEAWPATLLQGRAKSM